jgi:hypothetical protein
VTGHAAGEEVFSELGLAVDGLTEHGDDLGFEVGVPEIGLLGADNVDDLEGELQVAVLIAEDPVGAAGEAVQQALGAEEVDVGEGSEAEEAFDAGGLRT